MNSEISKSPDGVCKTGTPLDYSEQLYRLYFEIPDNDGTAERILREFLGSEHSKRLLRLTHGFEFEMPIQCVPDLVRLLTKENIAIYQIVRYAKVGGAWIPETESD